MDEVFTIISADRKPTMKLYRYFRNMEYATNEINSGEIFFPLSDSFNDPFDCRITNTADILMCDVKEEFYFIRHIVDKILCDCNDFFENFHNKGLKFDDMISKYSEELNGNKTSAIQYLQFVHQYAKRNEAFDDFLKMISSSYIVKQPIISLSKRVACFSEVNDSIPMWSYYADNHRGVCLEYSFSELDLSKEENLKLFNGIRKVCYSQNQYNARQYCSSIEGINAFYYNKALCWAHEQEWRIVIEENIERIKVPCLTGIYLGAGFRKEYANIGNDKIFRDITLKACSANNTIAVYEAKPNACEYKIDFTEIIPRVKSWRDK